MTFGFKPLLKKVCFKSFCFRHILLQAYLVPLLTADRNLYRLGVSEQSFARFSIVDETGQISVKLKS